MPSIDHETRNAFNELLVMDGLSRLPLGAILRVLQTIPAPVLAVAVSGALLEHDPQKQNPPLRIML